MIIIENDIIGNEYYNKNGQRFKVIEFVGSYNKNRNYKVRFDSGFETIVIGGQIKNGQIKDRFSPSVAGVGYLGNVENPRGNRVYSVWHNMINRCYNEKSTEYKRYGANGVKVCERWKCYEYFKEDIVNVDNYNEELFYKGEIYLDKDKKQFDKPLSERVYSLYTCEFISAKENNDYTSSHYDFKAVSPSGEVFIDNNLANFCKEHSLKIKQAYSVINGFQHTTCGGWRFKKI